MTHAGTSFALPRLRSAAAAGALALLLATPVIAQPGRGDGPGRGFGQMGDRGGQRGLGGAEAFGGMLGGAMRSSVEPEIFRRDLVMMARELDLDRGQQQIVEILLLDYEAAFSQAVDARRNRMSELRQERFGDERRREAMQTLRQEMREAMQSLRARGRDGGEPAIDAAAVRERIGELRDRLAEFRPSAEELDEMRAATDSIQAEWRRDRSRILEEFLSDLRLILNSRQDERWDDFERALRRERQLSQGTLSGESVDLFVVLREVGISGNAMEDFRTVLDAYAMELDDALRARQAVAEMLADELPAVMRERDSVRAGQLLDTEARARVRVRDVNDRYADLLEAEIMLVSAPTVADRFRASVDDRGYPRVFRPTREARAFDAALAMEELDGRIVADLAALRERYNVELSALTPELLSVVRREEPQQTRRRVELMLSAQEAGDFGARMRGQRMDDPIRDSFQRRDALDQRYMDELRALIGDELYAQLPGGRDRGGDVRRMIEDLLGSDAISGELREWLRSDAGQQMLERVGRMLRESGTEITPEMLERFRGMAERMRGAMEGGQGGRGDAGRGERGAGRGAGGEGAPPQRRPRRGSD